jgi:hypothetical protein
MKKIQSFEQKLAFISETTEFQLQLTEAKFKSEHPQTPTKRLREYVLSQIYRNRLPKHVKAKE